MGRPRKYKIKEDFFNTWNKKMSYVLGYWFADGRMFHRKHKGYNISFTSKDKNHLKKILEILESNYELFDKKNNIWAIRISSKTMYQDLLLLNGTPNKSLTATPPEIPDEYVYDFIRGYMDGDGWVSIRENKRNYPTLGFLGTKEMMDMFVAYLGKSSVYERKYPERGTNTFLVLYFGEKAINNLDILYNDASVYMQRKYNRYIKGKSWYRKGLDFKDREEVVHQYLKGLSLTEVGKNFNIAPKTVSNILKKRGVKRRTISESMKLKHKRRSEGLC